MSIDTQIAVRTVGLGKSFDPVHALRDVTLDLESGSVLALLGENGTGKSTATSCRCAALSRPTTVVTGGSPTAEMARLTCQRGNDRVGQVEWHRGVQSAGLDAGQNRPGFT
jgi:ABC-type branched-subunit amino acid transport system ATPase component